MRSHRRGAAWGRGPVRLAPRHIDDAHRPKFHIATIALLLAVTPLAAAPGRLAAQDNYEIQVYGSETVAPAVTMVELHSNFTVHGRRSEIDGLWPTQDAVHETLELTHGFTSWFETGFYVFTSARAGQGWQWVGDHIRPRIRVPDQWKWPVGVSLSMEVGYQRPRVSADTWTWEIRPIVDKQLGRWYLAVNPALERSLHGPSVRRGFEVAPNAAAGYDVNHFLNVAAEYYGSWGSLGGFDPSQDQQHQLFGVVNLNFGPAWEFNFGMGEGFTRSTDRLIVKMILGRRLPD
jgi:hypothetical protein